MKKYILIAILTLISVSCNKANERVNEIPIENKTISTNIRYTHEYVLEVKLNPVSDNLYIKYDDPDCFDYENLAYLSGEEEWYGEYILIEVDSTINYEFMHDYNIYAEQVDYFIKSNLNRKYRIVEEETIDTNNTKSFKWYLRKL